MCAMDYFYRTFHQKVDIPPIRLLNLDRSTKNSLISFSKSFSMFRVMAGGGSFWWMLLAVCQGFEAALTGKALKP